jgi:hypothetical protein
VYQDQGGRQPGTRRVPTTLQLIQCCGPGPRLYIEKEEVFGFRSIDHGALLFAKDLNLRPGGGGPAQDARWFHPRNDLNRRLSRITYQGHSGLPKGMQQILMGRIINGGSAKRINAAPMVAAAPATFWQHLWSKSAVSRRTLKTRVWFEYIHPTSYNI